MAETLAFSSGNFSLGLNNNSGTEDLAVAEKGNNKYNLTNEDGSTIKGLGIQGDNVKLTLRFSGDEGTILKDSTLNLGDDADTLVISGKTKKSDIDTSKGKDEAEFEDILRGSELDMGAGKDQASFSEDDANFALVASSIDMAAGNDRVAIDGGVKNSSIELGTGSDTLIFGGDILDTTVNLGGDSDKDTIRIAKGVELKGFKIEGAGEGDVLFIGSTKYDYNAADDTWVSGDDVLKF